MSSTLVSVLIPVYNGERYLREALESVLAQSHGALDIVVVDDGSTDRSPAILADFAARDDRVRVIRQPNGGISAALNAGLAAARGDYVARMDADDVMMPERIKRQLAFLEADPALGFCASDMDIIDAEGAFVRAYRPPPRDRAALDAMIARAEIITYTHPTVMVRTAIARELGGYLKRYEPSEDTELFGRMITSGRPGLVIPETLLRYRVHGGSISGSKTLRQIVVTENVRVNFYRRLAGQPEIEPDKWDAYVASKPLPTRLYYRASLRALALRQSARYALSAGRRIEAVAKLAGALALQPHKLFTVGYKRARALVR